MNKHTYLIIALLFTLPPALAFDQVPVVELSQDYAAPTSDMSDNDRLSQLERQIHAQAKLNLPARIEALQTDLDQLRGELEKQNHELEKLAQQQRAFYQDLDQRLAATQQDAKPKTPVKGEASSDLSSKDEVKLSAPKMPAKTVEKHSSNSAQQIYQNAYDKIKVKQYDQALVEFQQLVSQHPNDPLVANAHYWSGEIYSLKGEREKAKKEFELVINDYPNSQKVPDASLKIAILEANIGDAAQAKQRFQQVIQNYPGTAAARLAEIRLQRL